jgi:UrcA family protein
MSTDINLPRGWIRSHSVAQIVAFASLLAIAPLPGHADTPPVPPNDIRTAKVSLAGLDLTTADGVNAAYERLSIVAQRLCLQLGDDRKISYRETYEACVTETLADAVRRINLPVLAASEKSLGGR